MEKIKKKKNLKPIILTTCGGFVDKEDIQITQ